jgi:hypothetical protein
VEVRKGGILLGTIVEGADFGTVTYPLRYPFTTDDIDARLEAIEKEASAIWDWANKPCDMNGRFRINGRTTQAELGIDCPDVDREFTHFEQEGRSA